MHSLYYKLLQLKCCLHFTFESREYIKRMNIMPLRARMNILYCKYFKQHLIRGLHYWCYYYYYYYYYYSTAAAAAAAAAALLLSYNVEILFFCRCVSHRMTTYVNSLDYSNAFFTVSWFSALPNTRMWEVTNACITITRSREKISPSKYKNKYFIFVGFSCTDCHKTQGSRKDVKMILDLVSLLHHEHNL
jgi:hypothetical protein